MESKELERLLQTVREQDPLLPLYLVAGDLVLAEPAARRVAGQIAERVGCEITEVRRPETLQPSLQDLKTFPLFGGGKVLLVVESGILADQQGASELVDEIAAGLPITAGSELSSDQRAAASRLLQILRLFAIEPLDATPTEQVLGSLPAWALRGGRSRKRARAKGQVEKLRGELAALLQAAREAELVGWAEGELAELSDLLERGLPPGHVLVLAESIVAKTHPLVDSLASRNAFVRCGSVGVDRTGWTGLEALVEELKSETGAGIESQAVQELAERTLLQKREWGGSASVRPESTARFAAEYRKLAMMAEDGRITSAIVRNSVEDRGDEDLFQLLDDLAAGKVASALTRFRRMARTAESATAVHLGLLSRLAEYCRHVALLYGLIRRSRSPRGEKNYGRFRDRIAPQLQAPLSEDLDNPFSGMHAFRLHRIYLLASRLKARSALALPQCVLELELRLKGESEAPDVALGALLADLASGLAEAPARSLRL